MEPREWGALTPEKVADRITFNREQADWTYQEGDDSMPARQAEGVAGLWNKLALHRTALLADEVGTGKTLQALSVMALLWKRKPDARVLVMAPNRDICKHWGREFRKFVKTHYRYSDGVVRKQNCADPTHEPELCWSLESLANSVEEGTPKLFITTIYSLSTLVRGEKDEAIDRLDAAEGAAACIHRRLKDALGDGGFDLVVVDEAHYFRNSEGQSQRARAARKFFGGEGGRLGEKALLLTATPSHSSLQDVAAILGYFANVSDTTPEALLKKYALRRLRRMQGRLSSHDKYSYRNELESRADFDSSDPAGEMFFALYQKLLVEQQSKDGRRFLYGYLEGFESFESQQLNVDPAKSDDGRGQDFNGARDTDILKRLSRMHASLGGLPAHPKYDALVGSCMPLDIFDATHDLHEHKHLVFVRRIPSVREIAKRVNAAYDLQLARRIVKALALPDPQKVLKRWKASSWSRKFFSRYLDPSARQPEEGSDRFEDDDKPVQEHADSDADVHSHVANLFVVKKERASRSTDCSNFSLRLRKPESVFSLLLEPACDYRKEPYHHYERKTQGERERDDYANAARNARPAAQRTVHAAGESFHEPMPTLWGEMYGLLDRQDRDRLEALARDPQHAESFGNYIKHGFLFASPVIVELYCWYLEFQRGKPTGDAASRYRAFVAFIRQRLQPSMALAYFRACLETFEALCENVAEDNKPIDWHMLTGLNSPAFYASGSVNDRQRLILGFNSPFYPNVLASTSVLQEGVNLHLQCRKVHHYGIAWTPGDNEQRVGRVDRLFGKVNAILRRDDKAELAIYYPYLARSFDEEQLASFIRLKHDVEARMDACRQSDIGSEIDLQAASANWRAYLRKPGERIDIGMTDPYPYLRAERPAGDY